jgi:protein phosphatase 2C family protein 2/3
MRVLAPVPKSLICVSALLVCSVAFSSAEKCPAYGCPKLPLDVDDSVVRDALDTLRSETSTESDQMEALELLLPAGDYDKTTLTLKSHKGGPKDRQINQDTAIIYAPYNIKGSTKQAQLLGVFDGHGKKGEITSKYAATVIPRLLSMTLAEIDLDDTAAVSKAISDTFIQVDDKEPTGGVGGCTASIILQLDDQLYIANAGDSQSMISVYYNNQAFVIFESREDKPDIPEEMERIKKAGGHVHFESDGSDVPRAYEVLSDGRLGTGLAMSRAIGDWANQGVIPEPIVDVLSVTDIISVTLDHQRQACAEDESSEKKNCDAFDPKDIHILAISITDGVIDFVDNQEVVDILAPSFFAEGGRHPHLAAEELIKKAGMLWDRVYDNTYRDDITISALKVIVGDRSVAEDAKAEL